MIPTRLIALFALTVSLTFSESKGAFPVHIVNPDSDTVWCAGVHYPVEWTPIYDPVTKRTDEQTVELHLAQNGKILHRLSERKFNVSTWKVDIIAPAVNGVYEVALISDSDDIVLSANFTIVDEDT